MLVVVMSGAGYAYDWIRRRRREEERARKKGREIEKKVKRVMKYKHSRRNMARVQRQRRKKR
ncbi:hypothetical protein KAX01_04025 [Candidatus Bathyarchaeota archaeon]|nr:hypothetical protein [Candidatus Bathyarchaeota archaeon]